jgi:hypothetical protein
MGHVCAGGLGRWRCSACVVSSAASSYSLLRPLQWALLVGGEAFWEHACSSLAEYSTSSTASAALTSAQVSAAPLHALLRSITLHGIAFDRMATEEGFFTFFVLYHDVVVQQANGFYALGIQSAPKKGPPPPPTGTNALPAWLEIVPRLISLPALRWRLCFAEGLPAGSLADKEVKVAPLTRSGGVAARCQWVRPRAVPHWSWQPSAGQWHLLSPPVAPEQQ